ncbi:hypothetical protein [Planktotalea sp.]|uniref:hypothetical protein n=1 Tax=Planktotalea sp. TaxID=2029877 RepID=UPI0025FD7897|nr:hypothetical protein [Planktotalea sp.]
MRTGAVAAYGIKSRREGNATVQSYRRGQQALRKGGSDVDIEGRIKRIEQALDHLFDGLVKQRAQIGSGVAVDVAGHTLTAKARGRR